MLKKRVISMVTIAVMLTSLLFSSFALTALYHTDDWTANWIWCSALPKTLPEEGDVWANFRKDFTLEELPAGAVTAKIAAESRYWLYVNGQLVVFEGGLKRGVNREDGYYDVVDITKYLVEGQNTIAVSVWYYGVAGTASGDGRNQSFTGWCADAAGFMFESQIGNTLVKSDSSWKATRDGAYLHSRNFESSLPNYRFLESNIYYDASKAAYSDFMSWTAPDFDDSNWANASVRGSYGDKPWSKLYQRSIPLIRFNSEIQAYENPELYADYTDAATTSSVKIEMQLPYNAQVTPYLEVETTQSGQKIDIRTDTYTYGTENSVKALYVTKSGRQSFEALGWMSGEKVIYTVPAGVKIIRLGYRESGYNADFQGSFTSSDSELNTLWNKALRTLYITMRDNYMDCPDRERAQWWADVTAEMYMSFYSLDPRSWDLYEKGLYTKLGFINNDILYTVVPNTNYSGELPMQELAGIVGVWDYYLYTGRKYVIEDFYTAGRNYLALWNMHQNGLIQHKDGNTVSWGNWCDWGSNQDITAIENAWYYMALDSLINMAELLGKTEDIAEYEYKKERIAAAYETLWNGTGYKSSSVSKFDDRANALAVLSGLAPKNRYAQILKIFNNSEYYFASPYMEKYVLDAMTKMGAAEDVQNRIKTRYNEMINSKYSTLYEVWSFPEGNMSKNHAWSGGPLVTMSRDMAGIAPLEAGYEKYQIKPNLGSLSSVEVSVPSAIGDIKAKIVKGQNGTYKMDVTVPESGIAVVAVPRIKNAATVVSVNGAVLFDGGPAENIVSGVAYSKNDSDYIYFEASAAGTYTFETSLPKAEKDEYTLSIEKPQGGTLRATVGGQEVTVPYNASVAKGTEVMVKAVADGGYAFESITGSFGSSSDTFTFNVNSDITVGASFAKLEEDLHHSVTISIPDKSDVKVKVGSAVVADGETIKVVDGQKLILTAVDGDKFKFVNWEGDFYSADKTTSFVVTKDMSVNVKSAHAYKTVADSVNVALGGTVTSNYGQSIGTWKPQGLTDGNLSIGFTSYQKDANDAQWVIVDMGENKSFNTVTLYPRLDEICNFPEDFSILVSSDGASYTEFASFSGITNVTEPFECKGSAVSARYIKLDVKKLGNKSAGESKPRLQIMELEARMISYAEKSTVSVTLDDTSTGSGKLLVNGKEYTLPASVEVGFDELLKLEAVSDSGCVFAGMSGSMSSSSPVTYLYAKNNLELKVKFDSFAISEPVPDGLVNYALGGEVTLSCSEMGGGTHPQWQKKFLTDGLYADSGKLGLCTFRTAETPLDIVVDMGKVNTINEVVMWARTDETENGFCPYYPETFTINVSTDGVNYTEVVKVDGEKNIKPEYARRAYDFGKKVNARYIKVTVTKKYQNSYVQIQELEAYNRPENLAYGAAVTPIGSYFDLAMWRPKNLTDGLINNTVYTGYSSRYTAVGNGIIVDLGENKVFDEIILYARNDVLTADGYIANFPKAFTVLVSYDNETYTEVRKFTNQSNLNPEDYVRRYSLENIVGARYIKIVIDALGTYANGEDASYLQLQELQVINTGKHAYTVPEISVSIADGIKHDATTFEAVVDTTSDNIIVTVEDENGAVSHIADVLGSTVYAKSVGKAYFVVRDAKAAVEAVRVAFTIDHIMIDVAALDPTCEEDGYTAYKACTECDYTEGKSVIPALGHDWDEGVYTDPTQEDDGYMTYTCHNCGETRVIIDEGSALKNLVSIDVTWGSMEFIYDDGKWDNKNHKWVDNGWKPSNTDSNLIAVRNTGGKAVKIGLSYNMASSYNSLSGAFTDSSSTVIDPSEQKKYWFNISGTTENRWSDNYVAIGTITLTITE